MFVDDSQISVNTEYFHFNDNSLVDFTNLHALEFKSKRTKIHLDRINCEHVWPKSFGRKSIIQLFL